jgi:hypothetical protein
MAAYFMTKIQIGRNVAMVPDEPMVAHLPQFRYICLMEMVSLWVNTRINQSSTKNILS